MWILSSTGKTKPFLQKYPYSVTLIGCRNTYLLLRPCLSWSLPSVCSLLDTELVILLFWLAVGTLTCCWDPVCPEASPRSVVCWTRSWQYCYSPVGTLPRWSLRWAPDGSPCWVALLLSVPSVWHRDWYPCLPYKTTIQYPLFLTSKAQYIMISNICIFHWGSKFTLWSNLKKNSYPFKYTLNNGTFYSPILPQKANISKFKLQRYSPHLHN